MIMIQKKETTMKIDWKALDRCWGARYVEEYGHYFSDRSYIDISMRSPVIAAIEAIY